MFKKVSSTFFIKIIIAVLNLAIVIILSRSIGASGKGEASIIVTSIAMVLLACNMIGGSSLVYFVPRYNTFLLFLISNLWSVLICITAYITLQFVPLIPQQFITSVIILSLINSFLATNLSILLGKEKIMSFNYVSLLQTVINLVVLWLLVKSFNQVNIESYINSLYIAMGICLVTSTLLVTRYFTTISFENSKNILFELIKIGTTNQAGHILKFMTFRFSYYILSNYSGDALLGVYSNGISLIESLLLISNSFAAVLYPKVANSLNIKYSQTLTLQMTKISIIICVFALIPLMILPSEFWMWLFGREFNGVHQVIIILAPGIIFYNIALIIGHYFSGTGKYRVNTISSLIGFITTVLLSVIVIPNYGIWQAGIISTISYLVTAIFVMIAFAKEAKINMVQLMPSMTDFKWLVDQLKTSIKK